MRTTPEDFLRSVDDAKAVRRQERFLERATEHRLLDPWERYRALTDQYDRLTDISEQGDRKTRFALLILGSINAVNLLIVTGGNLSGGAEISNPKVVAYVACYALLSLCFFVYAIGALRPRSETEGAGIAIEHPLLHLDDEALRQPAAAYAERWQQAQIGEMNTEVAMLIHAVSRNNVRKLRALQRVYLGLYVLVGLTAMALVLLGARAIS